MRPDFFLLLFKVPKKFFVFVKICICKKLPFLTLNFIIKKKVDLIFKFPFTKVFKIDGKRCVESYKTLPKKLHREEIFEVRKTWFWENSDLLQRYKKLTFAYIIDSIKCTCSIGNTFFFLPNRPRKQKKIFLENRSFCRKSRKFQIK